MPIKFLWRFLVLLFLFSSLTAQAQDTHYADYVRPFIGSRGGGDTYPGPVAPYGMVQLSPDTGRELCSGYQSYDNTVYGFSLTHLSGTGIPELGDFLFVPMVGEPKLVPATKDKPGYGSSIDHAKEIAQPGYYKVTLQNSNILAELTATDRSGLMKFTFPQSDQASILTDVSYYLWPQWQKDRVVFEANLQVVDNSTITGFHHTRGWARDRQIYFAARYSKPFDHYQIISDGAPLADSPKEATGKNLQFLAQYKTTANEAILVKIAISGVSAANAIQNLDSDKLDFDFDRARNATKALWEKELAKIEIEGSDDDKATFYTAMYHSMVQPSLYQDVNGEYRGLDKATHTATGFTNYTNFSLWDTFRAQMPLVAILDPARYADMANSMLVHFEQSDKHMLPVWPIHGNETWCMIGCPAVPILADGIIKGIPGIDAEKVLNATKTTMMSPTQVNLPEYNQYGYLPFDKANASTSKTLEYAYDDWCVAQVAKKIGKTEDYDFFLKRSASYKNLYDTTTSTMRGKDSAGKWREPYDPYSLSNADDTEATAWQYTWFVPQDVPGLMDLMGGRDAFVKNLDDYFTHATSEKDHGKLPGGIGGYWHGNEPGHQTIYLYSMTGQPAKAAQYLHQVAKNFYGSKPDSLVGNDDCGQMSAWYVFTVLGFYPVTPGSDSYVIGAPQTKKAVIHLPNGKTFTVEAPEFSDTNIYIQSATLNGKDLTTPYLPYEQLKNGGTLTFVMGPQPGKCATNP